MDEVKRDVDMLVELICNEQTHMIRKDPSSYTSEKYKYLEGLKTKLKDGFRAFKSRVGDVNEGN